MTRENYQKDNEPKYQRNLEIYLDKMGFNKIRPAQAKPDKEPMSYKELILKYELSLQWLQKIIKRWKKRLKDRQNRELIIKHFEKGEISET